MQNLTANSLKLLEVAHLSEIIIVSSVLERKNIFLLTYTYEINK